MTLAKIGSGPVKILRGGISNRLFLPPSVLPSLPGTLPPSLLPSLPPSLPPADGTLPEIRGR